MQVQNVIFEVLKTVKTEKLGSLRTCQTTQYINPQDQTDVNTQRLSKTQGTDASDWLQVL